MSGSSDRNQVIRLSELVLGQEAVCYALLGTKQSKTTKVGKPFFQCTFHEMSHEKTAMVWSDHPLYHEAESWEEGTAYRLEVKGEQRDNYPLQLKILAARPAVEIDSHEGYDPRDLYATSEKDPDALYTNLCTHIDKHVTDKFIRELLLLVLGENAELFKKMQAARRMHHAYNAGLIEHVCSMSKLAILLADHYSRYYHSLNPPLNKSVIVATAILHDIGKVRESAYNPAGSRFTNEGQLIGHIVLGRDMVRDAAKKIDGFPEETLLLLEHAILSHHGKLEFGSPVLPKTMEALLVSFIDDLDAKMNSAAVARMNSKGGASFTDDVFYGPEKRQFYKGIPIEPDNDEDLDPA